MAKKKHLKKLSIEMSSDDLMTSFKVLKLVTDIKKKSQAKGQLFDFVLEEQDTLAIVHFHGADKKTLEAIYNKLIIAGAGQWTNGHYVATSAIAYPETLNLLLESYDDGEFSFQGMDDYNSTIQLAHDMCIYFDDYKEGGGAINKRNVIMASIIFLALIVWAVLFILFNR